MKRSSMSERYCPIARAAAQVVDAWTFLILREIFLGNRRFEGLRLHTGMSPRSLTLQLGRLTQEAILERVPCKDAPAFSEYRLTRKGLELWPVLVTLRQWGERWTGPWGLGGKPLKLVHRGRDHELRAVLACAECGEPVTAQDGEVVPTPAAISDRKTFAANVARASSSRAGNAVKRRTTAG